jgi:hypothetical protein
MGCRVKFCTHQRPGRTKLLKIFYPSVNTVYCRTTKYTYTVYLEYHSVCTLVRIGTPPHPHPQATKCVPYPFGSGEKSLVLCLLCVPHCIWDGGCQHWQLEVGNFVKAASSYWSSCKVQCNKTFVFVTMFLYI